MVFFNFLVMCSYVQKCNLLLQIWHWHLDSINHFDKLLFVFTGCWGWFWPKHFWGIHTWNTLFIVWFLLLACLLIYVLIYPVVRPWWSSLRPERNPLGTQRVFMMDTCCGGLLGHSDGTATSLRDPRIPKHFKLEDVSPGQIDFRSIFKVFAISNSHSIIRDGGNWLLP